MSNPFTNIFWDFLQLYLVIDGYCKFCKECRRKNCSRCRWDESENLIIPCSNIRCKNMCCMEHEIDERRGDDLLGFGRLLINTGTEYTVLTCRCMAPVCYDCIVNYQYGDCRICGEKDVRIDTDLKETIMEGRDFPYFDDTKCYQREKWMMAHQNSKWFIEENFSVDIEDYPDVGNYSDKDYPDIGNYPDFREWFFKQTGRRIDIIEMNTISTARMVNEYKLLKVMNFLYRQNFFVSIPFQLSQYSPELRFKRLSENSQTLCRFSTIAINSFLKPTQTRVYPFFGLTAKIIKILMQKTQKKDDLSLFFVRLIALYFQKRLRF